MNGKDPVNVTCCCRFSFSNCSLNWSKDNKITEERLNFATRKETCDLYVEWWCPKPANSQVVVRVLLDCYHIK